MFVNKRLCVYIVGVCMCAHVCIVFVCAHLCVSESVKEQNECLPAIVLTFFNTSFTFFSYLLKQYIFVLCVCVCMYKCLCVCKYVKPLKRRGANFKLRDV